MQVTSAEALVQSLSVDLFFYIIITTTNIRIYWNLSEFVRISLEYPYSNGFCQIPLEFSWNILSIGIPWNLVGIPMDSNGNCSRRLPDSGCFHQIPSDSIGISMELETRMAEASAIWIPSEFHGIPWNSDIPLGIHQIPLELMGEGKDLHLLSLYLECS